MLPHPLFADLLLHGDDELAEALGARIVGRATIHEWPLSCVQRLDLEDGRRLIYKSQRAPTVEAAFYARARSPLLPGHRALGRLGDCDILTIDWIEAPLLRTIAPRDIDLLAHGGRVIAEIAEIHGDVPVHLDVGSVDAWRAHAAIALEKLRTLVSDGRFRSIDGSAVDRVTEWSTSSSVLDAVRTESRLAHGDLKSDQVFVTSEGYRVIDWQRPVIAPPQIDLVSLLVEDGRKPHPYFDATTIRIFWFLRLSWAIEAQFDLFPTLTGGPFNRWAARAVRHILA
jgi:hypothetical protein